MEEKKHIDRLYQEKFKDFEAAPREMVWKNISSRLQQKERKRSILPIWYKIAGAAAILALFFNFATNLFKTNPGISNETASTQQNNGFGELSLTSKTYTEDMLRSSIILQALIQNTRNTLEMEAKGNLKPVQGGNAIAFSNIVKKPISTDISGAGYTYSNFSDPTTQTLANLPKAPQKELKDLTAIANAASALDNPVVEKNIPSKKVRITTIAAPVYYDNLGSGNAIDSRFNNNEGNGEISMAYGINFAYQVSEKIRIRSGISKVDLSYNTRDIAFTAAVNPTTLSGIDYKGEIPKYRIENGVARPFSNLNASAEFNRSSLASPVSGYLNQRLGFIEVPVEIEYILVDKKLGVNLIGGASTLFLDENAISLNSANFSTNIGQANNINSVSFSTNIGVGLDYKISPQFQLNLEPIFKYQVNTFTSSKDINPYYFGIYSGFSFKF